MKPYPGLQFKHKVSYSTAVKKILLVDMSKMKIMDHAWGWVKPAKKIGLNSEHAARMRYRKKILVGGNLRIMLEDEFQLAKEFAS